MVEASEEVQEFRQQNPNATKEEIIKNVMDNRAAIRQRRKFPDTRATREMGYGSGKSQRTPGA
jgi:hypothetical protein